MADISQITGLQGILDNLNLEVQRVRSDLQGDAQLLNQGLQATIEAVKTDLAKLNTQQIADHTGLANNLNDFKKISEGIVGPGGQFEEVYKFFNNRLPDVGTSAAEKTALNQRLDSFNTQLLANRDDFISVNSKLDQSMVQLNSTNLATQRAMSDLAGQVVLAASSGSAAREAPEGGEERPNRGGKSRNLRIAHSQESRRSPARRPIYRWSPGTRRYRW